MGHRQWADADGLLQHDRRSGFWRRLRLQMVTAPAFVQRHGFTRPPHAFWPGREREATRG